MMKIKTLKFIAAFYLGSFSIFAQTDLKTNYDVVVYGGTPAGIIAAINAYRGGASVVLLEQKQHIGGLITSGLNTDEAANMDRSSWSAMTQEYFKLLLAENPERKIKDGVPYQFESSVAEKVFMDMLNKTSVELRTGQLIKKVSMDGIRIESIEMEDGSTYLGKVFIDASYEGDLMAMSNISYVVGRESRKVYGESLAGIQFKDDPVKISPYDEKGLLPGVITCEGLVEGACDNKVLSYNYRPTLTKVKSNKVRIRKPKNYDLRAYELLARHLKVNPETKLFDLMGVYGPKPNDKYAFNNRQSTPVISLSFLNNQFEWPEASHARRVELEQVFKDYTQGYLYFLANDPRVPKSLRNEMKEWGYAKDEYADNDNFPYYLYIREGRRMIGNYVMTQKDLQKDIRKKDKVCQGSHKIDAHHVQRLATLDGKFINEGRVWEVVDIYDIPFGSFTPKKEECENLLVPVAASFSHVAYCSFRIEATWMGAGEACGMAAAMSISEDLPVQDVNVTELQHKLNP
jgi:hypothetical protein